MAIGKTTKNNPDKNPVTIALNFSPDLCYNWSHQIKIGVITNQSVKSQNNSTDKTVSPLL